MGDPRFAVYFVPPADSDLYRFGAGFLGYDCYTCADLGYPQDAGIGAPEWMELTREPRRYGFHATLKAPFRLRPASTEIDLIEKLHRVAASPRPVVMIEPVIQTLGRFIAIVPANTSAKLDRLAADCVTAFDEFRRPLAPRERRKRLAAGLSERQIENLDRWGYPYVFDEFRFHMTLSGSVDADLRDSMVAILRARFERINGGDPLPIRQVALVRQDVETTPFHLVCQAELNVELNTLP
jgi:putative phosphonate metabolism protein